MILMIPPSITQRPCCFGETCESLLQPSMVGVVMDYGRDFLQPGSEFALSEPVWYAQDHFKSNSSFVVILTDKCEIWHRNLLLPFISSSHSLLTVNLLPIVPTFKCCYIYFGIRRKIRRMVAIRIGCVTSHPFRESYLDATP